MKIKGKVLIIIVLLLNLFLTGCYDAREVDDEIYAISIGIDMGVDNKIRMTIQYPTYRGGIVSQQSVTSQSENAQEGSNVHTLECPSIIEGIDMLGMAVSRRVSLMHTKLLVFSEEIAKTGVGPYVSALQRFREGRNTMAVVVARNVTAAEFIEENKSNIGGTISKATELMFLQAKYNNYFPYVQFRDFYQAILSPYKQAIAIYGGVNDFNKLGKEKVKNPLLLTKDGFMPGELPRQGVAKREYAGAAVFDSDRMVGALDSYEIKYYLMIIGRFSKGAMTFEDPDNPEMAVVLDIRNSRMPRIKAYLKNEKSVIDVTVPLEADIVSIQSRSNYENSKGMYMLNSYTEQLIEEDMKKLIKKTQKEYRADIFGFGRYMAANFATIQEFENLNWLSHYCETEININVTVDIRRSGTMFRSSGIHSGITNDKPSEKGDKSK